MKSFGKKIFALALCAVLPLAAFAAGSVQKLCSPDGRIAVEVSEGSAIRYSVSVDGDVVISPSEISMTLSDGRVYGGAARHRSVARKSVDSKIEASVYRKSVIEDRYNQMVLLFNGFKLTFRAYDDGVAYRFESLSKKPFEVKWEKAEFAFPVDWKAYIPYVNQNVRKGLEGQTHNSFENVYAYGNVSGWDETRLAFLPLMVEAPKGVKLCITEADLLNYPGMFLYNGDHTTALSGYFPKYPLERSTGGGDGRSLYVDRAADYIASFQSGCAFPWRVVGISRHDREMADNDMVYRLASAPDPAADFSWVKPGKVAWDWWNSWNVYGVDFESGVNNETYKYYIDFASANGIEYIIMDEGWSKGFEDLFHVVPSIDLEELVAYGRERNVGIILWAGYRPFDKDMEEVCRHYSEMGIKGFKVDFMDACDQLVVDFHRRAAATTAKYGLLVDFHGTYKPTGLYRTYPNNINYEGIYGLENMKWDPRTDQVTYETILPYVRFFAGPADYTQGAMRNATRENYRAVGSEAMSQGTRCRQLAEYVVFSSPLNMLCDSPSNYMREPECTEFISKVPEIWDQTVALDGKVGEYVVIARRKGDTWYVGAMNAWEPMDLEISLDFLGRDASAATLYVDGVNASKAARDYKKKEVNLSGEKTLKAHLAPGGGFVAVIE
ncbi:MAG: glycoside hydrolase family 97 protein [Bacteroidales bacterium]|nr:glycoside hydrolase family 97 protein [Bacteroidales bacterium]